MDFITLAPAADNTWATVLFLAGLGLLVAMFFTALISKKPRVATLVWVTMTVGFMLVIGGITGAAVMNNARNAEVTEWKTAVVAEVQESYGIELTDEEFETLRFPQAEPGKAFITYGSVTDTTVKGDAIRQKTLTLVWANGELSLVSVKGTPTPLPVR